MKLRRPQKNPSRRPPRPAAAARGREFPISDRTCVDAVVFSYARGPVPYLLNTTRESLLIGISRNASRTRQDIGFSRKKNRTQTAEVEESGAWRAVRLRAREEEGAMP